MNAALNQASRVAAAHPGPTPRIVTERLVLRPHRLADADGIAQSLSDFSLTRMLSRVPAPYHRQDALDWLVPVTCDLMPGWFLAVTSGDDDAHIGTITLELRHARWHLGYWLNRFYWRRGIMSEALPAVIERFQRRMPQETIHSGVFVDNPASLRLQEKLGFRMSGCSEVYSFARSTMVAHVDTELRPNGPHQRR